MALTVGDKLGPYAIRSRIVAGGMGEVHAHKTLFEKSVAQAASGWANQNQRGCAPLRFRSAHG